MSNKYSEQFLINSLPRTGSTWLQFILSFALASADGKISEAGAANHVSTSNQYFDKFVIKMHHPIALYAKYDTINQIYIAREPKELIASIVTKTLGGLGDTVSNGIAMPPEFDSKTSISSLIVNQLHMFENYSRCALANTDRIKIYTFDTITKNIEAVVKNELGENYDVPNSDIPYLLEKAKSWIKVHNTGHPGFNNGVPTEKPKEYYDVLTILNTFNLDKVNELYERVKAVESI